MEILVAYYSETGNTRKVAEAVFAGLEHADPKDLIASMRVHEAEVMRLLGEIEALVNGVQA